MAKSKHLLPLDFASLNTQGFRPFWGRRQDSDESLSSRAPACSGHRKESMVLRAGRLGLATNAMLRRRGSSADALI